MLWDDSLKVSRLPEKGCSNATSAGLGVSLVTGGYVMESIAVSMLCTLNPHQAIEHGLIYAKGGSKIL